MTTMHERKIRWMAPGAALIGILMPLVALDAPAHADTQVSSGGCDDGTWELLNTVLDYTQDSVYHHWQWVRYQITSGQNHVGNKSNFSYAFYANGVQMHTWSTGDDVAEGVWYQHNLGWASVKGKNELWDFHAIFDLDWISGPDSDCYGMVRM